jgi:predicted enzyme related to lactoylglutathione lyase
MTPRPLTLLDARPTLSAADVPTAVAFWTEVVGLDVEATMGDPVNFAMVTTGDVRVTITEDHGPQPSYCPIFLTVDDLDALVLRLAGAGITVESEPTTRQWGIRDLVVRCPGGGPLLAFGEVV